MNPVRYERAIPVFVDSERDTWNMDPRALEKAFEKYPHPAAVIAVHLYGTPAKIDEIRAVCDKHQVPLIDVGQNPALRCGILAYKKVISRKSRTIRGD